MKIFLSHASPSKPLVRRLTDPLPRHVDRWLDQDELGAGQKFAAQIEAIIRNESDFLVVFVDEHALDSEWVRREVALGIQRHQALRRPFVLPVLLGPHRERMGELGLPADEWLYIDASDLSDDGVAASARALEAELFKHASLLVERLRSMDRRALIDDFSGELAEFEQAAFQWVAAMTNPIRVLASNQQAFDHVRDTLAAYNDVANRFIPRLPDHRDRLQAGWRDRRSLVNHIARLVDQIEDEVYRGTMYRLNDVLAMLHDAAPMGEAGTLADDWLAPREARKQQLLDDAKRSLADMTEDASRVMGDLSAELDT